MNTTAQIGGLLKHFYRLYTKQLLQSLEQRGFTDLRPSFLEILLYLSGNEGASIKDIGNFCQLKKQTMTTHMNELLKRGYIIKRTSPQDKRQQSIFFTEYGLKFKMALLEISQGIHDDWGRVLGEVELKRLAFILDASYQKMYQNEGK